ncbi:extensin family protein [uncultured Celeribacter sp.]|uniref:extensin-like domain-containing protein n=1 Tax=uncultured Celeribacter sp. TaxID=1303376 RepID=UPI002AA8F7E4|nr:extensin family protein [uncultured Celeribacter sp.]
MGRKKPYETPPAAVWVAFSVLILVGLIYVGWQLLTRPSSPVPRGWNPLMPLHVQDDVTPLTKMKLARAESSLESCLAALDGSAEVIAMSPLEATGGCGIEDRVTLSTVGESQIDPLQTSCAIALRTAMWERHGLQPAAEEIFGTSISVLRQIGSYNCRVIRTPNGNSSRLSTHATGEAIDITGFDLSDGTRIRLMSDWDGDAQKAAFLRAARESACTWFATTLSPDYNSLHADHFHLQSRGWGACR